MAVRIYSTDLKRIQERLPSEAQARAVAARAINRAMQAGRTTAVREVAKNYVVRQRQVTERMTTSTATAGNLSSRVTWRGQMLNLADFRVTPNKPNPAKRPILRVAVSRKEGAKPYPGAFLINTRAGTKVYRRVGKPRYPITGVWGPSIPQLVGAKSVREAVESRAMDVLQTRLSHEINRELLKGAK